MDLHDLKWRYQQLQTQHDYILSKYNAHVESTKHNDVKLEVLDSLIQQSVLSPTLYNFLL